MASKRHLPVISTATSTEDPAPRGSASWVLRGTVLAFVLWMPMTVVSLWLARLASKSRELAGNEDGLRPFTVVLPLVGSFMLATYLAGAIVARFGPPRAVPAAAAAGALSGLLVCSLAALAGALRPWVVGATAYGVLISVGCLAAAAGGHWGQRRRNAARSDLARPGESRPD